MDELVLAELLSVKICHDLAGPVGAINNGTELLKDGNDDIYERSLDLVEGSAKDAVARIMYFRHAYGSANPTQETTISSLKELTDNMFASSRAVVEWPQEFSGSGVPQSMSSLAAKLTLNLISVLAGTLIHGGHIHVRPQKEHGKNMVALRAEGKDMRLDEEIIRILTGKKDGITPTVKNIQAYISRHLLGLLDLEAEITRKDDGIEITTK